MLITLAATRRTRYRRRSQMSSSSRAFMRTARATCCSARWVRLARSIIGAMEPRARSSQTPRRTYRLRTRRFSTSAGGGSASRRNRRGSGSFFRIEVLEVHARALRHPQRTRARPASPTTATVICQDVTVVPAGSGLRKAGSSTCFGTLISRYCYSSALDRQYQFTLLAHSWNELEGRRDAPYIKMT
jgi:hypothetical protein